MEKWSDTPPLILSKKSITFGHKKSVRKLLMLRFGSLHPTAPCTLRHHHHNHTTTTPPQHLHHYHHQQQQKNNHDLQNK